MQNKGRDGPFQFSAKKNVRKGVNGNKCGGEEKSVRGGAVCGLGDKKNGEEKDWGQEVGERINHTPGKTPASRQEPKKGGPQDGPGGCRKTLHSGKAGEKKRALIDRGGGVEGGFHWISGKLSRRTARGKP